jgi:hypothetical protein
VKRSPNTRHYLTRACRELWSCRDRFLVCLIVRWLEVMGANKSHEPGGKCVLCSSLFVGIDYAIRSVPLGIQLPWENGRWWIGAPY